MRTIAPEPQAHGDARIIGTPSTSWPITVQTGAAIWSNAVSFSLQFPPTGYEAGELRVIIDLEVEAGAIGIGCMPSDFSSYTDREVFVPAGIRRKVYVPIGAAGAASQLMLRNVSPHGGSAARIHGIEIRNATAAEERREQLRVCGPIGAAVAHGDSTVQALGPYVLPPGFQPVVIETDVPAYSYAASFGLTVSPDPGEQGRPWTIVDLEVETGAIWVGCTTPDYTSYTDREIFIPAGERRKAYVPMGPAGTAHHVMLRNDSLDGRSTVRVHNIECRPVTDAEKQDAQQKSLASLCLDAFREDDTAQICSKRISPLAVQSAAHPRDQRIGGMATMPSRAHTFELALASILPQLDRIYVYLDKYNEVPSIVRQYPKVVPLLPSEVGDLQACGKFLGCTLHEEPCFYFCFDDDIFYPPDYVEVMSGELRRHDLKAVVGVHGYRLKPPYLSFLRDRDVVEFRKALSVDCCFDVVGTGTVAFHTSTFRVDPYRWRFNDMADIMVAIEAAKRDLPRIGIRRPKNYLRPLDRQQPDSIYVRVMHDDSRETAVMRSAIRSCSLSWSFSPIATQDELSADEQECGSVVIEATHGVVPTLDPTRLTHVGLIETDMFIAELRSRARPYVSLDACLRGEGDALTIDDSTRAGLKAARLAREYGHEVTFFLNPYNIAEKTPYFFARLSAALDATEAEIVAFEDDDYNLGTIAGKQRFRAAVKGRLAQLGSDQDCQDFVGEIGLLLGIDEIVVPEWLQPITTAEVRELAAEGVAMQNHGWTHLLVGSLSPNAYADNIRRGREWLQDVCGAEADFFAVPNGDVLPLWETSADYRAWLMLDAKRRFGRLAPGVFNRRALPGHC